MSNTVAIYNFKGGVGKTTTALNLGISWAKSFKVLLIDFDPQCNLTNATTAESHQQTIYTEIKNLMHDHELALKPIEISPYLHVIPGDFLMSTIESNSQFISFGPSILEHLFSKLKFDYDFVIIDCPTNFGTLVKSILAASHNLLIPAVADSFSISGVQKLITYLATLDQSDKINILGVFFNMYNKQLNLTHDKLVDGKSKFGDIILNSTISRSVRVGEANEVGQSVEDFSPDNQVAKEFMQLSEELLTKLYQHNYQEEMVIPELYEKMKA